MFCFWKEYNNIEPLLNCCYVACLHNMKVMDIPRHFKMKLD